MALVELLELTTKLHCSKGASEAVSSIRCCLRRLYIHGLGVCQRLPCRLSGDTPLFGGVSFTIKPIVLERRLDVPNETHQGTGEPTPVHV